MPAVPSPLSVSRAWSSAATIAAASVLSALCFSPLNDARAATITLAGTIAGVAGDDNDEIDRWRSASVLKSLDLDLDNVYGTAGYVMFGVDNLGNGNAGVVETNTNPFTWTNGTRRTVSQVPSYLSFNVPNLASAGVASSYGYRLIDDPTVAPGATVANLESGAFLRNTPLNTEASLFDIVVGSDFPSGGLRLGLLYGNTDAYTGTFRIEQMVGGTGNLTVSQTSSIPLEMAFFDITGAVAGDTFRIYATKNVGSTNANVLLGGITFDAIPEPSAALSLLGGFGILIASRRARRTA